MRDKPSHWRMAAPEVHAGLRAPVEHLCSRRVAFADPEADAARFIALDSVQTVLVDRNALDRELRLQRTGPEREKEGSRKGNQP